MSAEDQLRSFHEKEMAACISLGSGQSPPAPNNEESTRNQNAESSEEIALEVLREIHNVLMGYVKVYNRTTGRFYIGFSPNLSTPIWSPPHKPSEGTLMPPEIAAAVVKQLTILEPSLDLQIVD